MTNKKEYINLIKGNVGQVEKNLNNLVLEIEDVKKDLASIKNICEMLEKEPKEEKPKVNSSILVSSLQELIKSCYETKYSKEEIDKVYKETKEKIEEQKDKALEKETQGLKQLKQELEKENIACGKLIISASSYQMSFKKNGLTFIAVYFPIADRYKLFRKNEKLITTKNLDAFIKFCKNFKFIEIETDKIK